MLTKISQYFNKIAQPHLQEEKYILGFHTQKFIPEPNRILITNKEFIARLLLKLSKSTIFSFQRTCAKIQKLIAIHQSIA